MLECVVIGVPDKDRGQAIKAIVKMVEGTYHDKNNENEIRRVELREEHKG